MSARHVSASLRCSSSGRELVRLEAGQRGQAGQRGGRAEGVVQIKISSDDLVRVGLHVRVKCVFACCNHPLWPGKTRCDGSFACLSRFHYKGVV